MFLLVGILVTWYHLIILSTSFKWFPLLKVRSLIFRIACHIALCLVQLLCMNKLRLNRIIFTLSLVENHLITLKYLIESLKWFYFSKVWSLSFQMMCRTSFYGIWFDFCIWINFVKMTSFSHFHWLEYHLISLK